MSDDGLQAGSEIPEFVDVVIDGIPDDEYERSRVRHGKITARVPVAEMFRSATIAAQSVEKADD